MHHGVHHGVHLPGRPWLWAGPRLVWALARPRLRPGVGRRCPGLQKEKRDDAAPCAPRAAAIFNPLSHGPRSSGVSGRSTTAACCTTGAADFGRRLRRWARSASVLSLGYEIELWKDCHLISLGSPFSPR